MIESFVLNQNIWYIANVSFIVACFVYYFFVFLIFMAFIWM